MKKTKIEITDLIKLTNYITLILSEDTSSYCNLETKKNEYHISWYVKRSTIFLDLKKRELWLLDIEMDTLNTIQYLALQTVATKYNLEFCDGYTTD
jgi:hypothetical protein